MVWETNRGNGTYEGEVANGRRERESIASESRSRSRSRSRPQAMEAGNLNLGVVERDRARSSSKRRRHHSKRTRLKSKRGIRRRRGTRRKQRVLRERVRKSKHWNWVAAADLDLQWYIIIRFDWESWSQTWFCLLLAVVTCLPREPFPLWVIRSY